MKRPVPVGYWIILASQILAGAGVLNLFRLESTLLAIVWGVGYFMLIALIWTYGLSRRSIGTRARQQTMALPAPAVQRLEPIEQVETPPETQPLPVTVEVPKVEPAQLETVSLEEKVQEPVPVAASLPAVAEGLEEKGRIREEWRRCGKPGCHCAAGKLHGPYLYRQYRENGKVKRQYLGKVRARQPQAPVP